MLKLSAQTRNFLRGQRPPQTLWRGTALAMIHAVNAWMSCLNYRCFRHEPEADPADASFCGPVIFIFWHEYIPFPLYIRPNCRLAMLLSQHQDAEILSHIASFAGLEVVRGSSNRGGTAALRELIEHGRGMSLAITPDGPRGPRRRLAQGCIYLSSRLQIPIVPLAVGYDRPWRNRKSWDHFAFPRPFSRCRAILGPRIQIAPDLDREQIESNRIWVEQVLSQLTETAEQWAESKIRLVGEPLYRKSPDHSNRMRNEQKQSPHWTPPPLRVAS